MRSSLITIVALASLVAACAGSTPPAQDATKADTPSNPADIPGEITCDKVPDLPRTFSVVLNMEPLRGHPLGQRLSPLVFSIPGWHDVLDGVVKDPVNEVDWVYMGGPSLADTTKDVVFIHHQLSEETVERGLEALAKKSPATKAFDLGVDGTKGTYVSVDQGPRVVVRAQEHILAIVPPERATDVARILVRAKLKSPQDSGQALHAWLNDPHGSIPTAPPAIKDLTVMVGPRSDGGADAALEAECTDETSARDLAETARQMIRRNNNLMTRVITGGLLEAVVVKSMGSTIHADLNASSGQVSHVLDFILAAAAR